VNALKKLRTIQVIAPLDMKK